MDPRPAGRGPAAGVAAALLLLAGVAVAAGAAKWTEVRARTLAEGTPVTPAYLGFGACLVLAFAAGRLAASAERPAARPVPAPPPAVSGARALSAIGLGVLSALLFAWAWILQGRPRETIPLFALAPWAAAIAAAGGAFALASAAGGRQRSRSPGSRRAAFAAFAAVLVLVAAGSYCRLAGLGEIPANFGGDEANQVQDGLGLATGTAPGDPFGIGWYGTMRLGMLPAGVGALASSDPIAGPRIPYAVVGALSVATSAAAGWLVAGAWGAVGAAALLAFAPYHLHFSRLASVMILDALAASLFAALALRVRKTGSPATAFATGAVAGLALYGYTAGRVIAVVLAVSAPALVLAPRARGRRAAVAAALAAGFFLAAAPNLRVAATDFANWNSRFNQVGIFRQDWWPREVERAGSAARVLERQFVAGTAGLLYRTTAITWYTGHPMVAPAALPALAAAGLGWLAGRRRFFEAALLGLLVAGNLAAVVLTDTTPSPQRLSILFPAFAILSGVAIAAVVGLLPRGKEGSALLPGCAGALLLGVVATAKWNDLPPWQDPSPRYGGDGAALVVAARGALTAPRYRSETIFFDGRPHVDSSFPSFRYLVPSVRIVDRNPGAAGAGPPPPGVHLLSAEWLGLAPKWQARFHAGRAVRLADPRDPLRDIGCLLRVPPEATAAASPQAP